MSYEEDAARIERDYVDSDSVDVQDILEDLDDADFDFTEGDRGSFLDAIMDDIGSTDDVDIEPNSPDKEGITTREEVDGIVRSSTGDKAVSSDRQDAITDAVSSEVGAPRSSDLRSAQIGTLSDSVTPSDVIDGDSRTSQISVVRNSRGDAVATIGGGGASGEDVASELGTEHFSSPAEYTSSLSAAPSPDGSSAAITLGDDVVGEVDIR